jgi:hypothetical protein
METVSENVPFKNSINFQDVRESLNTFTGDDTYSVKKWIADLEEMRTVCSWSDVEIFIYAKRLLSGTAALFVRSDTGICSWPILCSRLLEEFQRQLTDADIHRQLAARVKRNDETHQQNLFKMMELAGQGTVPEDSVIDYVISGIRDNEMNKSILYGARTISEFKTKLILYVKIKSRMSTAEPKSSKAPPTNTVIRCFNCGSKSHQAKECPDSDKGAKCFSCINFGHRSFECPNRE